MRISNFESRFCISFSDFSSFARWHGRLASAGQTVSELSAPRNYRQLPRNCLALPRNCIALPRNCLALPRNCILLDLPRHCDMHADMGLETGSYFFYPHRAIVDNQEASEVNFLHDLSTLSVLRGSPCGVYSFPSFRMYHFCCSPAAPIHDSHHPVPSHRRALRDSGNVFESRDVHNAIPRPDAP